MSQEPVKQNKNKMVKKAVLITLAITLILVLLWNVLLPILGITVAVSATIWSVAVATVVLICVSSLLFFIFTGIGIFVLGLFVFIWTVSAIVLFPLLFPVLIPVLLLMFVIGLIAGKKS